MRLFIFWIYRMSSWNTIPQVATKSKISYIYHKVRSQGQKVIDLVFTWMRIMRWVCMQNMKSLSYAKRRLKFTKDKTNKRAVQNIAAAFRGMHAWPAKHSYVWLQRKCDYQTDTQTDAKQSDPYVPLCFAGETKTICPPSFAPWA